MSAPFENMLIVVPGKELPDWVVERLVGDIAKDGSFEFEASDGPTTVRAGHAIFQINGGAYTCTPKEVQAKLAVVVGTGNKVVADLIEKTEGERDRVNAARRETYSSNRKPSPTDPDYRLKLKPIIGSPPAPQFVAVENLLVDDTYQRSIEGGASRKMIVKIAENWDWRLCLPLLVSRRDGRMYVIDGQHRKEAAELRGDIAHLPVVVFDFNDPKAEAELFVEANRSRRAMSKLDDFHAAVVAGDPVCVAINDVVTAAGLKVGRVQAWQNWKPGEVVFTSVIGRALKAHGHTACVRALGIIARAFEGMTLVGGGSIFEGVMAFLHLRGKENLPVEDTLLELVLSSVGIPGWKEAIEGTDGPEERVGAMLAAIRLNYSEAEAE